MNIWFWFYINSTPSKQEIYFERTVLEKTDHIGGPHFFRGQDTDVKIFWYDVVIVNFFFYFGVFLLPSVVTGTSFMSISLLVRELWQFSIIRDWPEIRKSEIPPSEFFPISGDWAKSGIPNLTQIRMSLMKCYWML